MKDVKLDVSPRHVPFMADAIRSYADDLAQYITGTTLGQLEEELEQSEQREPESFGPGLTEMLRQAIDKGEFEKAQPKRTKKAPYGYKADGTPKQKPGRKA